MSASNIISDCGATGKLPPLGLILTGGLSARMGSDKALLQYHGRTQREHLFLLLENHCSTVFTSCRRDQEVPTHLNPLRDAFECPGPLNGILSAFHTRPETPWLVVAVDMPNITSAAISFLMTNRAPEKHATCFFRPGTRHAEPLFAIWEPHAYSALREFAMQGGNSPRRFLMTTSVRMIEVPDEGILMNCNSPTDFRRYRRTVQWPRQQSESERRA